MTESRILAAFWQPLSKRFVELTADEIRTRVHIDPQCPEFRQLLQHRVILSTKLAGDARVSLYRLAPEGERRVSAMIVMGRLPGINRRLTAIPQKGMA